MHIFASICVASGTFSAFNILWQCLILSLPLVAATTLRGRAGRINNKAVLRGFPWYKLLQAGQRGYILLAKKSPRGCCCRKLMHYCSLCSGKGQKKLFVFLWFLLYSLPQQPALAKPDLCSSFQNITFILEYWLLRQTARQSCESFKRRATNCCTEVVMTWKMEAGYKQST